MQDRSFEADGSLFYPDTREFFDGITGPYIPDSEFSPIWNPEFFGNMIIANGNTWPFQVVEQLQLPLHQHLAAAGEVDEHGVDVAPQDGLFDGEGDGAAVHGHERLGDLADLVAGLHDRR